MFFITKRVPFLAVLFVSSLSLSLPSYGKDFSDQIEKIDPPQKAPALVFKNENGVELEVFGRFCKGQ